MLLQMHKPPKNHTQKILPRSSLPGVKDGLIRTAPPLLDIHLAHIMRYHIASFQYCTISNSLLAWMSKETMVNSTLKKANIAHFGNY